MGERASHIKLSQPVLVVDLVRIVEGEINGNGETRITSIAPPDAAEEGSLVFALSASGAAKAAESKASAVVAPPGFDLPGKAVIRVDNPRYALALGLRAVCPRERPGAGVHPSAVVVAGAALGEGVSIGALTYVGEQVSVGKGSVVGVGCVIETNVRIGSDCRLHSNVTICQGTRMGARVEIHSGTVIGSDGFGYIQKGAIPTDEKTFTRYFQKEEPHIKIPQIGNVIIEDDVEIGANSTVDRGTMGATVIRNGVKIDNQVQIAHNVEVGEHAIIVSQVGISGHTRIGKHATLGGQAGLAECVVVGDGALVSAQCGIAPGKHIPPGSAFAGWAGRPAKKYLEMRGAIAVLPRMIERLRALEKEVAALRETIERESPTSTSEP